MPRAPVILGGIDASFEDAAVLERNQLDAVICNSRGMRWHLETGHLMTNDIACLLRGVLLGRLARARPDSMIVQLSAR